MSFKVGDRVAVMNPHPGSLAERFRDQQGRVIEVCGPRYPNGVDFGASNIFVFDDDELALVEEPSPERIAEADGFPLFPEEVWVVLTNGHAGSYFFWTEEEARQYHEKVLAGFWPDAEIVSLYPHVSAPPF